MGCLIGAVRSTELASRLVGGAQWWIASRSMMWIGRKAYLLTLRGKLQTAGR